MLAAVLEADLGTRAVTWFRLARPVLLAGVIIAFEIKGGGRLSLALALGALGIVLGLAAGAIFRVFRDGDDVVRSMAGAAGYAALWIAIIGARLAVAYLAKDDRRFQTWLYTHQITSAALTDALIFMPAGLLLARTGALLVRSARVRAVQTAASSLTESLR
ncbi:MAG TPA: hypothetical protein VIY52_02245 [Streptosporangiaceae bacterium]